MIFPPSPHHPGKGGQGKPPASPVLSPVAKEQNEIILGRACTCRKSVDLCASGAHTSDRRHWCGNPVDFHGVLVGADAERSCSRRRSVTDAACPLRVLIGPYKHNRSAAQDRKKQSASSVIRVNLLLQSETIWDFLPRVISSSSFGKLRE